MGLSTQRTTLWGQKEEYYSLLTSSSTLSLPRGFSFALGRRRWTSLNRRRLFDLAGVRDVVVASVGRKGWGTRW